jgi:hypothetical protein
LPIVIFISTRVILYMSGLYSHRMSKIPTVSGGFPQFQECHAVDNPFLKVWE